MLASHIYAAHRAKVDFKAEPNGIQEISLNGETFPAFTFDMGELKGIMPVYETGEGFFNGTKKEYLELPGEELKRINIYMTKVLGSDLSLPVRVLKISDGIVYLSRKAAMSAIKKRTLKKLKISDMKNLEGKTLDAEVIALAGDFGALCDIGGMVAFLPREEIDYSNPDPGQTLSVGTSEGRLNKFRVKVKSVKEDSIVISRKAVLPDPWKTLDLEPGQVAKSRIIAPAKKSFGFVVEYRPGIIGYARANPFRKIPGQYSYAPVRVEHIDKKNKRILGLLI